MIVGARYECIASADFLADNDYYVNFDPGIVETDLPNDSNG